jgi:hypothetical protein
MQCKQRTPPHPGTWDTPHLGQQVEHDVVLEDAFGGHADAHHVAAVLLQGLQGRVGHNVQAAVDARLAPAVVDDGPHLLRMSREGRRWCGGGGEGGISFSACPPCRPQVIIVLGGNRLSTRLELPPPLPPSLSLSTYKVGAEEAVGDVPDGVREGVQVQNLRSVYSTTVSITLPECCTIRPTAGSTLPVRAPTHNHLPGGHATQVRLDLGGLPEGPGRCHNKT